MRLGWFRNLSGTTMNKKIVFAIHLQNLMAAVKISEQELALQLGYQRPLSIQLWLKGLTRPAISQLVELSAALAADPVDLLMAWIIDQESVFEELLWAEVLDPRRSLVPHSKNLPERPAWPEPTEGA